MISSTINSSGIFIIDSDPKPEVASVAPSTAQAGLESPFADMLQLSEALQDYIDILSNNACHNWI